VNIGGTMPWFPGETLLNVLLLRHARINLEPLKHNVPDLAKH